MRLKHWLKNNKRIVLLSELGDLCTELAKDSYFEVEHRVTLSMIADLADNLVEILAAKGGKKDA